MARKRTDRTLATLQIFRDGSSGKRDYILHLEPGERLYLRIYHETGLKRQESSDNAVMLETIVSGEPGKHVAITSVTFGARDSQVTLSTEGASPRVSVITNARRIRSGGDDGQETTAIPV